MLTAKQDRPWNDPGPRSGYVPSDHSNRPTLKAIILDFSSVNNVDITSVQHLIDVRNQLDRYAAPERVEWHLACINNRWTKRALASAGFGFPNPEGELSFARWKPIFSVAEIGGSSSAAEAAESRDIERDLKRRRTLDVESAEAVRQSKGASDAISHEAASAASSEEFDKELSTAKAYSKQAASAKVAVVHGLNRPLFHIDLTSALQSAITNVERRGESEPKGVGNTPV